MAIPRVAQSRMPTLRNLLIALIAPATVTLLAIPDRHPPTGVVSVLYVLAVVIVARVGGSSAGIIASLTSFLALNFFFTKPLHTFAVSSPEDLVALLVFLVASIVVGLLLSSAIDARARAERREIETRLLNRLATRMLAGEPAEKVLDEFATGIALTFKLEACEITSPVATMTGNQRGLPRLPDEVIRLGAPDRDLGEMRLWNGRSRLGSDEKAVIQSIASQLAVALEGTRLSKEVRRAELEAHSSQLKAALFSGVTHDVKTPLAAIKASVTSLLDGRGFGEADRRKHLDTIQQETDRLHRVVNNLLDVARLRAGALVASKVPTAIDELMESVLNRMRGALEDRPVDLRVAEDVPEIPLDVVQIDQVLTNLVENAIKFTPPGVAIALQAVGSARCVRVTISDQGPGIPKEDRVRIFEPFERGHESGVGTGLGLAICHAIVAAHGGRIWVSDNPRGGAAFTFELPCVALEQEDEEERHHWASAGR